MMDESHRLKPFSENLNSDLFEKLYYQTRPLRYKLAKKINPDRFGVDLEEIVSWFDIKFIFTYQKYAEKYDMENEGDLKGYIIRALQQYSNRVMRSAYKVEFRDKQAILDIDAFPQGLDIPEETYDESKDIMLSKALAYLKTQLSPDAYFILEITLRPPGYILAKLEEEGKKMNSTIPAELIAEYLDWPINTEILSYIKDLRKDINKAMISAQTYFKGTAIAL